MNLFSNRREKWLASLVASGAISTPALLLDTEEVEYVLSLFEYHLPEAKLFYAVKANNSPGLLQFLSARGVNFDVASAPEITELRKLGVPASRMILSNPIKTPETVNAFFDQQVRLAVIDNPFDLAMLKAACERRNSKDFLADVFVRIRIPSTDVQIDLNQKFGATEDEAIELLNLIAQAGFTPRGIQFHVGTQSWNTTNYKVGTTVALRIMDEAFKRFGIRCDSLNIGGGFPDPVLVKESGGYDEFFTQLRLAIAPAIARGLNIIAEPGRIIASGACSGVCTVVGKSVRNGTPWLYLDDGAYGMFSGKFFDYKEYHFKVIARQSHTASSKYVPYVIAGPTCDSLDIICQTTMLPKDLGIGDILCTHNMGAYSTVTASSFNGFGRINVYIGASSDVAAIPEANPSSRPKFGKVANIR